MISKLHFTLPFQKSETPNQGDSHNKVKQILSEVRRIQSRRGTEFCNTQDMNIKLWELGELIGWNAKQQDFEKLKREIKKVKRIIEESAERMGRTIETSSHLSPSEAVSYCRIASALELIRDITQRRVLKNNTEFEFSLLTYFDNCPSLDLSMHRNTTRRMRKVHWWWTALQDKDTKQSQVKDTKEASAAVKGNEAYKSGSYLLARQHFEEAVKVNDLDLRSMYYIAKCMLKSTNFKDTIQQCRITIHNGIRVKGDVKIIARAYVLKGRVNIHMNKCTEGTEDIEKAITFLAQIAKNKLSKGRNIECLDFCNQIAKIGRRNLVQFELMERVLNDIQLKAIRQISTIDDEEEWNVGRCYLYVTKMIELAKNYYRLKNDVSGQHIMCYNLLFKLDDIISQRVEAGCKIKFKREMKKLKKLKQKADAKLKVVKQQQRARDEAALGRRAAAGLSIGTISIVKVVHK